MACSKPFRLLQLPSLVHDVIFSLMSIEDVYHLSKCSTRSRCAVKMFTRRQSYHFGITVDKYYYGLGISSHERKKTFCHELRPKNYRTAVDGPIVGATGLDYRAAAKEEILYFLDVFTRQVNHCYFPDATKVIETTEFLMRATPSPVDLVNCSNEEAIIDDNVYKYVLKEFKNAKRLMIGGSPSSGFRFDEMEPFTNEYIGLKAAHWVTLDHLIRCFSNVRRVWLTLDADECLITPQVMPQFFNAWRNGSGIRDLELECYWRNSEFQAMFQNVPKKVVKRVEVESMKQVFKEGRCFLIRQEESGVEAIAYRCDEMFNFTTNFRLLRDDETAVDSSDSDDDFIDSDSDEDL